MNIKRLIIMISIIFLFISCTIYYFKTDWDYRMPYEVGVSSPEEAFEWVVLNIEPMQDKGGDVWQLPHETYERRLGDCEDRIILFMYLVYYEVGIENIEFVLVENHAVARISDVYYDPTFYYIGQKWESWEILYVFSLGVAIYQAKHYKN